MAVRVVCFILFCFSFAQMHAVTYTDLINFNGTTGSFPFGSLIQASDGKLYGMTTAGGVNNSGALFSYDPVSATYVDLFDFTAATGTSPRGSLLQASDGKLYGMTAGGGANNSGALFSYDPASATYVDLFDFTAVTGDLPRGSLLQASDGKLYGMTLGGGANSIGVLFSYDPVGNHYTDLIDFTGTSGSFPEGSLIQASDGKLYGMATSGGTGNFGVLFSYDPVSAHYTDLINFTDTMGPYEGSFPYGSLLQASDGKLYGMTNAGGANGAGVLFSYDPVSSTYIKFFDFVSATGSSPRGSLIQAFDDKLYGVTWQGGMNGVGVVFSYDLVNHTYADLFDLTTATGSSPQGSLIQASDDNLYGMTELGGTHSSGVLFSYGPIAPPPSPPIPSPPTSLTGIQNKEDVGLEYELFNVLNWGPSSSAVAGYYVYREGVRIATLGASTFQYVDHNRPKGVQTLYTVTAFDAQGNQSTPVTTIVP